MWMNFPLRPVLTWGSGWFFGPLWQKLRTDSSLMAPPVSSLMPLHVSGLSKPSTATSR